jgi:hypothetical protein
MADDNESWKNKEEEEEEDVYETVSTPDPLQNIQF